MAKNELEKNVLENENFGEDTAAAALKRGLANAGLPSDDTDSTTKKDKPKDSDVAPGGVAPGLFNFQAIMDNFYGMDTSESPEAAALKGSFEANMIQSAFDGEKAKSLAYANQAIASSAMNQAANLEQRNMAQVMKDEYVYGMTKMGAEYDFQSRFAVDEANRNLKQMASAGDITQRQTQLEGVENRLNLDAQGRNDIDKIETQGTEDRSTLETKGTEDRKLVGENQKAIGLQGTEDRKLVGEKQKAIGLQGSEDRSTDLGTQYTDKGIGRIGAAGVEQRATQLAKDQSDIGTEYTNQGVGRIGATGQESRKTIGTQGSQDRLTIKEQGAVDESKIRTTGDQTRQTDTNRIDEQSDADVRSIGAKGDDDRKTLERQNRLEAKSRANQSKYARGLAGMF